MDFSALADGWWVRTPIFLRRYSALLSAIWSDGAYLLAWPMAAVVLPAAALLFGLIEGATHWSPLTIGDGTISSSNVPVVFAQMFVLLVVAVIAASLSANLGLMLVLGFALADFIAGPRVVSSAEGIVRLAELRVPQLVNDTLFFMLAVTPAVTAKALLGDLSSLRQRFGTWYELVEAVVRALCQTLIVSAWVLSIPMIIRISWVWAGWSAPITFIYFRELVAPWLPLVLIACLTRAALAFAVRRNERVASAALQVAHAPRAKPVLPENVATVFKVLGVSLLITLLAAGYISSLRLGVFIWFVFAALLLIHMLLLPRLQPWGAWASLVGRVPALVRWIVLAAIAYPLPRALLMLPGWSARANYSAGQFGAEIVCLIVTFVVALALFPAKPMQLQPRVALGKQTPAISAAMFGLVVFALSTTRARAICADPSCCFNGEDWLAALAAAALLLALAALFIAVLAPELLGIGLAVGGELAAGEGAVAAGEAAAAAAEEAAAAAAEAAAEETAAEGVASTEGWLPNFNPDMGTANCGDVAVSLDSYLGGGDFYASSAEIDGMADDVIANDVGANWSGATNPSDISSWLDGVDGSRGIVGVAEGDSGHVFNVINNGGQIIAIDGQSGVWGSLTDVAANAGYEGPDVVWQFLPTWP